MNIRETLASALGGRYDVGDEIGAGGMATVFVARDVRHNRQVAVKVLHPELSAVLGPERFLKEIELTAGLQHPHILPLFDSGSAGGLLFYVMPYVEGETLRARLAREQQLPVADALRIATDVADALEYAHRRGIVHRDVKPENILLHEGRPLVADFGIALAVQQAGGERMTQTGMSLGTPYYMAPEQALGDRPVDLRADIYALGAVTYEMLAGEPPFTGPNAQAVTARVLTTEPTALTELRRSVPLQVGAAVMAALQKVPADRFPSAAAFAAALAAPAGTMMTPRPGAAAASAPAATPAGTRRRMPALAAAVLVLIAVSAGGWFAGASSTRASGDSPVRFAFALGVPQVDRPYVGISRDGRQVVQVVTDSTGLRRAMIRGLDALGPVPVPGTENATHPVFSPDGRWLSFSRDNRLWKVPTGGGPAMELGVGDAGGGSWTDDGDIVFTVRDAGLWRVSSSGGQAVQLTELDTLRGEFQHWHPQVLPGGRGVVFTSFSTPIERARIEVYDFRSGERRVLVDGAIFPRYSPSGHLLYVRDGALFAIPFDPRSLKVRGTASLVLDGVAWVATDGMAGYDVAADGTLVYVSAAAWNRESQVVWVDRTGRELGAVTSPGAWSEPRLAPDGRWIALTQTRPKQDVFLLETARGLLVPLTRAPATAANAVWMPDSRSLLYTHEAPVYDTYLIGIDGGTAAQPVFTSRWDKLVSDVSRDGRTVLYSEVRQREQLYVRDIDGGEARPLFQSPVGEQAEAVFSRDGRWILFTEIVDARATVHVARADGTGGRQRVSASGGLNPVWTRADREIIYRSGEAIYAVPFDPATGDVGTATELFRKPATGSLWAGRVRNFDVTPDGSRFLVAVPVESAQASAVVVVLGWRNEVARRTGRRQ
jgi:eukaryotic-like serine/threonine-protein kinase